MCGVNIWCSDKRFGKAKWECCQKRRVVCSQFHFLWKITSLWNPFRNTRSFCPAPTYSCISCHWLYLNEKYSEVTHLEIPRCQQGHWYDCAQASGRLIVSSIAAVRGPESLWQDTFYNSNSKKPKVCPHLLLDWGKAVFLLMMLCMFAYQKKNTKWWAVLYCLRYIRKGECLAVHHLSFGPYHFILLLIDATIDWSYYQLIKQLFEDGKKR